MRTNLGDIVNVRGIFCQKVPVAKRVVKCKFRFHEPTFSRV